MAATGVGNSFKVDVADLRALTGVIRKAPTEIQHAWKAKLKEAGEVVAAVARQNISLYSGTVPATVKVRATGAAVVSIVAGNKAHPLGGLLERGNRGSRESDSWRHPVFGHEPWVEQTTHPYLRPAAEDRAPEVAEMIAAAVTETLQELRLT